MAHPYHHALSSTRIWGGRTDDYLAIHSWFDEPEHVIAFVLGCAEAFDLRGRWGFRWALTCSRPRLDGFGGGAQLLDLGARRSLAWIDCEHWVLAGLDPEADPDGSIVGSVPAGGASAIG